MIRFIAAGFLTLTAAAAGAYSLLLWQELELDRPISMTADETLRH